MSQISRRGFLKSAGAVGVASILNTELASPVPQTPPWPIYLPQVQKAGLLDRLNVITIVADNLRYDHIGAHGNAWIQTPNIDAFAAQSQVFEKMYAGGFPTVINRAELFTGRYMFHRMGWSDLPDGETVLASMLGDNDYLTGLVFDNWHLKDHGFSFDRGFHSWEWIRGQEGDRYRALPIDPTLPCSAEKLRDPEEVRQYLRNQAEVRTEDQYCTARTIQAAIEWLERYAEYSDFYLHIDCFDPHEPWNPPASYIDLYSPGYTGERILSPAYAPPTYLSQAELEYAQALYAAEVTMVDHWLGVLFEALETMQLSDNTIVVFCSDHGYLFGEHNAMGKSWDQNGHYEVYPLYEELIHVPLMIRVPGVASKRISSLAQTVDILPTILDFAGIPQSPTVNGLSLRPVISSDSSQATRQIAISARTLNLPTSQKPRITVTDGKWVLLYGGAHTTSELYDLESDSHQQNDLMGSHCGEAKTLHTYLTVFLDDLAIPEDKKLMWSSPPC